MNNVESSFKSKKSTVIAETENTIHPFSHLQWYLHHSNNTVYLAAESSQEFEKKDLHKIAGQFMELAPQLRNKVAEGNNGHIGTNINVESICKFEVTDDLYKSLSKTLDYHARIYSDPALPNFRAYGFRLRNPKKGQINSLYICCSSHALMEGSESARILRVKQSVHHAGQAKANLSWFRRTAISAAGLILAPFHLVASAFNRSHSASGQWAVIDISRKDLKKLAKRLGVRQRSILFSLPIFALHLSKNLPVRSKKKAQLISYSTLPDAKTTLEDSALNLRMQVGRIPTADNFEAHVKETSKVLDKENTTEVYSQAFYNSILGVHRSLQKIFPYLYGKRFFTYIPYDFVLSLLPPHVATGFFRPMFDNSIFCGSYTPGVNSCVFAPYRNGVSLNFYLAKAEYNNLDVLMKLLKELDIECRRVV